MLIMMMMATAAAMHSPLFFHGCVRDSDVGYVLHNTLSLLFSVYSLVFDDNSMFCLCRV